MPKTQYIQVTLAEIDEGALLEKVNNALARAGRELDQWEKQTGQRDGKATVYLKIEITRMSDRSLRVKSGVRVTIPEQSSESTVKFVAGMLLCQPRGAGPGDPDQFDLFDDAGRPMGDVDTGTGEILDPDNVAGRIKGA